MRIFRILFVAFSGPAIIAGCAHSPAQNFSEPELADQICSIGKKVGEVSGSISLEADSEDLSGRYPADVLVKKPANLDLEVTNPFGGTEARIQVRGARYQITVPGKKTQTQKGYGSWSGVPIYWSTRLFLGQIPCPSKKRLRDSATDLSFDDDWLKISFQRKSGNTETYLYRIGEAGGRPWPEEMQWEISGTRHRVEFWFEDPAEGGEPRKWGAESSKGKVTIKWRKRDAKTI